MELNVKDFKITFETEANGVPIRRILNIPYRSFKDKEMEDEIKYQTRKILLEIGIDIGRIFRGEIKE